MRTILVVEDDRAIRETVVDLLKDEGFSKVSAVRHGKEAITWLEAASEMPGLILLDLMMPVMDGESFLRAVQVHPNPVLRSVPVIVLTASRRRTELPGCVTWLDKPIDIERLLQLCSEYVGPIEGTAPLSSEPLPPLGAR
ncbi:MAG: response regulator [Archangiaceae bacterium]|nr:response regulator [Archangiaceae bacterium]